MTPFILILGLNLPFYGNNIEIVVFQPCRSIHIIEIQLLTVISALSDVRLDEKLARGAHTILYNLTLH